MGKGTGNRSAVPLEYDHTVQDVYLFPDGSRVRDNISSGTIEREYITPDGNSAWYVHRRYYGCSGKSPIEYCYGCRKLFYFEDARYRCCSEECRKEAQLRGGRERIAKHNIARSYRLQLAREGMKCLHCGNTIWTETNRKRYCNASCKQAAYRQRQVNTLNATLTSE